MKKKLPKLFTLIILLLAVLLITLISLSACNYNAIDAKCKFDHAYIKIGETWKVVEVKSWRDFEGGELLQLKLKDGTVILTCSMNCTLYNGNLPTLE